MTMSFHSGYPVLHGLFHCHKSFIYFSYGQHIVASRFINTLASCITDNAMNMNGTV